MTDDPVALGEHCRRLLHDEVLASILAAMIAAFRATAPGDSVARDAIHARLLALSDLRDALRTRLEAGRLAAERNESEREAAKARRARGVAPGDPI
jgi:hypothetical protein